MIANHYNENTKDWTIAYKTKQTNPNNNMLLQGKISNK